MKTIILVLSLFVVTFASPIEKNDQYDLGLGSKDPSGTGVGFDTSNLGKGKLFDVGGSVDGSGYHKHVTVGGVTASEQAHLPGLGGTGGSSGGGILGSLPGFGGKSQGEPSGQIDSASGKPSVPDLTSRLQDPTDRGDKYGIGLGSKDPSGTGVGLDTSNVGKGKLFDVGGSVDGSGYHKHVTVGGVTASEQAHLPGLGGADGSSGHDILGSLPGFGGKSQGERSRQIDSASGTSNVSDFTSRLQDPTECEDGYDLGLGSKDPSGTGVGLDTSNVGKGKLVDLGGSVDSSGYHKHVTVGGVTASEQAHLPGSVNAEGCRRHGHYHGFNRESEDERSRNTVSAPGGSSTTDLTSRLQDLTKSGEGDDLGIGSKDPSGTGIGLGTSSISSVPGLKSRLQDSTDRGDGYDIGLGSKDPSGTGVGLDTSNLGKGKLFDVGGSVDSSGYHKHITVGGVTASEQAHLPGSGGGDKSSGGGLLGGLPRFGK